jgi:hypothetical protein
MEPVLIPWDCADGFFEAHWRRPEAYLDEHVRRGAGQPMLRTGGRADRQIRSLPAETVELTVSHASEERAPFARRKLQNQTIGVPAVADTDPAIEQAGYFDAVAVGETQGALHPART